MRAALVAAALASPFTDLAAAKAARRVWQGRLTEARLPKCSSLVWILCFLVHFGAA